MHPYGILSNFKQFLDSLRGRGMRYIFHGTEEEWDALTDAEKDRYDQAELSGGTDNSCPIYVSQQVAEGDLNPVSSDAVYNALKSTTSNYIIPVSTSIPGITITKRDNVSRGLVAIRNGGIITLNFSITVSGTYSGAEQWYELFDWSDMLTHMLKDGETISGDTVPYFSSIIDKTYNGLDGVMNGRYVYMYQGTFNNSIQGQIILVVSKA